MSHLHEPGAEEQSFELESETEWEKRRDEEASVLAALLEKLDKISAKWKDDKHYSTRVIALEIAKASAEAKGERGGSR